jgi:HPt (histidine-containing phosphotransfer) domain-containing protein
MDPAFAAQFRKIQQTFIAGLPQRLHDIQQAPDAQACHVALHRLAGAAGGYGFANLSALAREAMECQQTGEDLLLEAALQRLAQAMAAIQAQQAANGSGVDGSGGLNAAVHRAQS